MVIISQNSQSVVLRIPIPNPYFLAMPKLSLDISHVLSQEEATKRLQDKFAAVRAEYHDRVEGLRETWTDHTLSFGFHVLGMGISGTVAVEPEQVRLVADLPMAAAFFKGAIEQRIRHEVDALLAPNSPH